MVNGTLRRTQRPANVPSVLVAERTKICPVCKLRKPWSDFYARKNGMPGGYCKPCDSKAAVQRQRNNPERERQRQKEKWDRASEERRSERRVYQREYKRRVLQITPERFRASKYMQSSDDVLVPTRPVAMAFERAGLTQSEVAIRMGWEPGGKVDTSRVTRTLARPMLPLDLAVSLLDAMGLDPVEVGL